MIEPGMKFDFGEMPDFGAEIKKVRLRHKLTQAQFGELIGKSATTVHSYETNKILPPFEVVLKIASLFDVSTGDLMGFKSAKMKLEFLEMYDKAVSYWKELREYKKQMR